MEKFRTISVSRTGLEQVKIPIDNQTIAIYLPKDNIEAYKDEYVKEFKKRFKSFRLEHIRDVLYKKPFWKFWGVKDYSLAIFKITYDENTISKQTDF